MSYASDNTDRHLAYSGTYGEVRFAIVSEGQCPSREYWDALNIKAQAKWMTLFESICSNPQLRLFNWNQFHQVEGDLYEFKRIDLKARYFCFRNQKCWYLLDGFSGKKEDKLPKGVVDRAKRLMEDAKQVLQKQQSGRNT